MAPAGKESNWIKAIPGNGWFTYFRSHGPQASTFDGTWKLKALDEAKAKGWTVVDMKRDWKVIFPFENR